MSDEDGPLRSLRVALGLAKPKARPLNINAARGVGCLDTHLTRYLIAQLRVLVLGLERSGKSTWLRALAPGAGRGPAPPPTVAPRVERVVVRTPQGAFKLRCTDLPGGAEDAADLWPRHFPGAHALVFVLDAADALRVQAAQDALDRCALQCAHAPVSRDPRIDRSTRSARAARWRTLRWRGCRCCCWPTRVTWRAA